MPRRFPATANPIAAGRRARAAPLLLLASAIFAAGPGCSMFDSRLPDDPRKAYLITYGRAYEMTDTNGMVHSLAAVDGGKPSNDWRLGLAPGRHRVTVHVTWPDQFEDETPLSIDAVAGHRYGVGTFFLKQGQKFNPGSIVRTPPPTQADHAATAGADAARLAMMPIAVGGAAFFGGLWLLTLPISLPLTLIDLHDAAKRSVHKGRPFEGCCYVWIEDLSTGQIVAGEKPPIPPEKAP